ncbi:MAG TPA: methenyltetrahydrofolate cyclohydrolase [Thermoplasmatales archaeon]|nr:methenyltetrahydrofolate cyclohydrolase [Thermoplasmatales archaeon]
MTKLVDMKIKEFLEELASDSPAPGGGSVAALSGALAAALSSMVCNLTIGKEKYADVEDEMEDVLERCNNVMKRLIEIIDEDTEAFNMVMEAFKLPKGTDEEKMIRKERIQESLKKASLVPLETARLCVEIMELARVVTEKGNKNSITDAAVSAILAKAGLESAILNVKINLKSINDERFIDSLNYEMEVLERNSEDSMKSIMEIVTSYV